MTDPSHTLNGLGSGQDQGDELPESVRFIHDGEWAQISILGTGNSLAVYPREDATFSIGRPEAGRSWRDLVGQSGFANMRAAIDQAVWLTETPDVLRRLWS